MGEEGEDNQSPLLASSSSSTEVSPWPVERTGTLWTATAHVITGVIGAGVLSLAWSTAQLGWIAGPMSMLVFAGITLVSTNILCDCYMYPDPEHGPNRIKSYMDAVKLYLGEKSHKVCGVIAQESLYGNALAYIITSATSIKTDSRNWNQCENWASMGPFPTSISTFVYLTLLLSKFGRICLFTPLAILGLA